MMVTPEKLIAELIKRTRSDQIEWLDAAGTLVAHGEPCSFNIATPRSQLTLRIGGREYPMGDAFELHRLVAEKVGGVRPNPDAKISAIRKAEANNQAIQTALDQLGQLTP